ncbi:hypothetical protein OsI_23159 [Oryza sativa Indica Group]|uniref:Uncharacterized protein n=1 Tax=Oryza sativa subsp. indica TaxID=39946 RepID=B8B336_ORYSI|nr:hypothetical protein OsI_23159 [Oryza sativa Indica Group]
MEAKVATVTRPPPSLFMVRTASHMGSSMPALRRCRRGGSRRSRCDSPTAPTRRRSERRTWGGSSRRETCAPAPRPPPSGRCRRRRAPLPHPSARPGRGSPGTPPGAVNPPRRSERERERDGRDGCGDSDDDDMRMDAALRVGLMVTWMKTALRIPSHAPSRFPRSTRSAHATLSLLGSPPPMCGNNGGCSESEAEAATTAVAASSSSSSVGLSLRAGDEPSTSAWAASGDARAW